jgi:heptosyltransferase-2
MIQARHQMQGRNPSSIPDPRRILVRGVNWLGDAVMSVPALERLRERFGEASITLLTPEKLADLWKTFPALNSTVTIAPGESPFSVGRRLRTMTFDTALVQPNSPRSAIEPWFARIPQRIGYARPWRNWFLTRAVPPRPGQAPMRKRTEQEVRRLIQAVGTSGPAERRQHEHSKDAHQLNDYLHLAASLGANPEPIAPRLSLEFSEVEAARGVLLSALAEMPGQEAMSSPPVFVGLNPSAAYGPAKRWPPESFAAAAQEISRRAKNIIWVAIGQASDRELCEQIVTRSGVRFINLAGKTSLRQLMGVLSLCRLLLTNDSGPMHLAAALGATVVVPFGSTSPELTGPDLPGQSRHRLLTSRAPCSPCFRRTCPIDLRCLTGITVDQVVTVAIDML